MTDARVSPDVLRTGADSGSAIIMMRVFPKTVAPPLVLAAASMSWANLPETGSPALNMSGIKFLAARLACCTRRAGLMSMTPKSMLSKLAW